MRRAHNGSGRILGQVQVRLANVQPGRVLGLCPDQAASRPGRVLGRAIPFNPTNHGEWKSVRVKFRIDTTHLHYA